MAQTGKKSPNLSILSEIYHEDKFKAKKTSQKIFVSLKNSIKEYFSDPKKVEATLSGAVLFFGIFGLIFGFIHFKNQIRRPFLRPAISQKIELDQKIKASQDLLGLTKKDTDQDGLSDYDELYIYKTSPYLEDTDSDGIDDKSEISRGANPTCPVGQNCFAWESVEQGNSQTGGILSPAGLGNLGTIEQLDPQTLRGLLRQAGADEATLNSLSDTELMTAYQEVLAESLGASSGTASQKSVALPPGSIESLTPQQIREMLFANGVSQETLNQVSDEELMNLVQETLQEQQ